MAYEKLFDVLKQFEDDFYHKPVEVSPNNLFDQYRTISRTHSYYSDKFEGKNNDTVYFHNLGRDKVRNAVKNVDLDTKDMQLVAENPVRDWLKAYVAKEKLKRIFKKMKLGKKLNESTRSFAKIGSLVLKKNKKGQFIEVVDLRNLVNEPSAKTLKDSPFVMENHYLLPHELIEISKGWEKEEEINEIISRLQTTKKLPDTKVEKGSIGKEGYINIKEVYAMIPESYLDEDGDETIYSRYKIFCVLNEKINAKDVDGWLLYNKQISDEEWPYKEHHLEKIEGRWLGFGIMEELFTPQVRKNELVNLRYSALRYAALVLLQTQDNTILRNILTDLENGDIVSVNQLLTRVPTEVRDHAVFSMEENDIEGNAARLTNSFEVTTGEQLPSGTPYSLGALLNQNANKYYEFIREDYGLFWKEVLMDWIVPQALSDFNKQEFLKITDKDILSKAIKEFAQNKVFSVIKDFILNFGRKPKQQEYDLAVRMIETQMQNEMVLDIPENWLKDFEYDFDFIVTGEKYDKKQVLITVGTILQILGQNPQVLENPLTKRLFTILLETAGVSIGEVGEQVQAIMPQQTGAVSGEAARAIGTGLPGAELPAPVVPQAA